MLCNLGVIIWAFFYGSFYTQFVSKGNMDPRNMHDSVEELQLELQGEGTRTLSCYWNLYVNVYTGTV
jgi:hypothetical protein